VSWRSTRAAGQGGHTNRQVAVVDLGSNSWRLVVFTYSDPPDPWWKLTDELYETVRIGAGLAATGKLSYEAIGRGLETLGVFARFCRANHLEGDAIHVVATSAIRDAANGERFLADAQAATGLHIETLSAEDEARYGYVAAVNTSTLTDGVVLDIGGGSMQLIHVAGRDARESASFPLGAVRITEQFLPGDGPAKKKEIARLRDHVAQTLSGLDWLASSGKRMVGIGGAVRNLAAAAQAANGSLDLGVQGFLITPKVLTGLANELASMSVEERGMVPGAATSSSRPPWSWTLSCSWAASTESRPPRPACARACSSPARSWTRSGRCSTMSATRPCATSPSSTSPTWLMSSTSPSCRCRCSTRSSTRGCSSRPTASASCCGPPRCCTTWA
jgi:hypothetical protein